jgi:predicted metal-dependent HD superfamily phosphohydrolase
VNFDFWKRIGAQGDPSPVYARLVASYSEPHRAYHNLTHIRNCLEEFEKARHLAAVPDSIEMAIWFHDAVYNPRAKDNEERSAELALSVAREAKLPAAFSQRVADLILATRHAAPPPDPDAALLVDVDLSILGQPSERFDDYERQIRQEYDWVEAAAFAAGRGAILKSFLERAAIFSTPFFRDKYERQARENLKRSIESWI